MKYPGKLTINHLKLMIYRKVDDKMTEVDDISWKDDDKPSEVDDMAERVHCQLAEVDDNSES
ncbi:hypothetical protein CVD25_11260 [Bacillus canaveralius]|uniref:Uncharacterized protein n=1 Tax=Bacillus canaveralius TaxID=1403243 RepID=A0A2N5GLT1_9BACI|nr:hypothetical protein CU635_09935 [Bacillus canaveralius]PLR97194.1 hypothetical protein CVD25_11260 [Bacillus canaveralius]